MRNEIFLRFPINDLTLDSDRAKRVTARSQIIRCKIVVKEIEYIASCTRAKLDLLQYQFRQILDT